MNSSDKRLNPFKESQKWKNKLEVTDRVLSDAGFYYTSDGNLMKCWYCNGGLRDWQATDRPWVEHAKYFPLCEFVLQKQGIDFVENIVNKYPHLQRPQILNPPKSKAVKRLKELLSNEIFRVVDPRKDEMIV